MGGGCGGMSGRGGVFEVLVVVLFACFVFRDGGGLKGVCTFSLHDVVVVEMVEMVGPLVKGLLGTGC